MRSAEALFCLLLVLLATQKMVDEHPTSQWVVWNVGQGQWMTYINKNYCWHFDFGGEVNPINRVTSLCSWRENILLLSHPDRDHHSFLKSLRGSLKNLCLLGPSWRRLSHRQLKKLNVSSIPYCNEHPMKDLAPSLFIPVKNSKQDDNRQSQIAIRKNWLIPGDALKVSEKEWLATGPTLSTVTHLLLGHHGSKTSTSDELLKALPKLRQCIASSRQKKYGHPHRDVRLRVRRYCSLILTEDWGHLHYFTGL